MAGGGKKLRMWKPSSVSWCKRRCEQSVSLCAGHRSCERCCLCGPFCPWALSPSRLGKRHREESASSERPVCKVARTDVSVSWVTSLPRPGDEGGLGHINKNRYPMCNACFPSGREILIHCRGCQHKQYPVKTLSSEILLSFPGPGHLMDFRNAFWEMKLGKDSGQLVPRPLDITHVSSTLAAGSCSPSHDTGRVLSLPRDSLDPGFWGLWDTDKYSQRTLLMRYPELRCYFYPPSWRVSLWSSVQRT